MPVLDASALKTDRAGLAFLKAVLRTGKNSGRTPEGRSAPRGFAASPSAARETPQPEAPAAPRARQELECAAL